MSPFGFIDTTATADLVHNPAFQELKKVLQALMHASFQNKTATAQLESVLEKSLADLRASKCRKRPREQEVPTAEPQRKRLAPSKELREQATKLFSIAVMRFAKSKGVYFPACPKAERNISYCRDRVACALTHTDSGSYLCSKARKALGWPNGVPFTHPRDMKDGQKRAFLEAFQSITEEWGQESADNDEGKLQSLAIAQVCVISNLRSCFDISQI